MARQKKVARSATSAAGAGPVRAEAEETEGRQYCALPEAPPRVFDPSVSPDRMQAIIVSEKKWVNGTRLRYHFFDRPTDGQTVRFADGTSRFVPWAGPESDREVVRAAFAAWKAIGIGLDFEEVARREDAEIRIGFMRGDGAWSYLGRDVLDHGPNERTMNFGWALAGAQGRDTALHEIGHTLGLPHEHQNPNAGIVWNEEEVYRRLALPPNRWSRATTFHNIIRKIPADTVRGTEWDRDSVMHYPFDAGMILVPEEFRTRPLVPAGNLSPRDIAWMRETYPPLAPAGFPELKPFVSHPFALRPGAQFDARFRPEATRKYTIQTFGDTDTVMVLFEETGAGPQFLAGDDDSGTDRNARIRLRLIAGRSYLVRLRLFYNWSGGESAVMVW